VSALLEPVAESARWSVRKPQDLAECLQVLPRGGPSVLVVRPGRDVEGEMMVLERVARLYPGTALVVVGDAEQSALTGLAWDLGARFVCFSPLSRDLLPDAVKGLLTEPVAEKG
jgi:hypothetical protein